MERNWIWQATYYAAVSFAYNREFICVTEWRKYGGSRTSHFVDWLSLTFQVRLSVAFAQNLFDNNLHDWRSQFLRFYGHCIMDFNATKCEWSRRRRRAETELQTVSRRAIELDRSRRRRDG